MKKPLDLNRKLLPWKAKIDWGQLQWIMGFSLKYHLETLSLLSRTTWAVHSSQREKTIISVNYLRSILRSHWLWAFEIARCWSNFRDKIIVEYDKHRAATSKGKREQRPCKKRKRRIKNAAKTPQCLEEERWYGTLQRRGCSAAKWQITCVYPLPLFEDHSRILFTCEPAILDSFLVHPSYPAATILIISFYCLSPPFFPSNWKFLKGMCICFFVKASVVHDRLVYLELFSNFLPFPGKVLPSEVTTDILNSTL